MATQDYYGGSSHPQRQYPSGISPLPPSPERYDSSVSLATSYHSQQDPRLHYSSPDRPAFKSVDSTSSFPSTYGLGSRTEHGDSAYRDDIPLTSSTNRISDKHRVTDHVYDAPLHGNERSSGKKTSSEDQVSRRGFGFFSRSTGRIPWVVYALTITQISVFIAELVKMGQLTGLPIQTKPSINPMIGPSPYVLINMGARYVTCMHPVAGIQDSTATIAWPCPNSTSSSTADASNQCTLSQLCGFGGVPNPVAGGSLDTKPFPNQWFRFILPIFLHAGIIHIGFNMLLQITLGREMEIAIGPLRFFLVYMASGVFGFVLGGNFAASGIASTGASGALFGIIALNLLDLLYTWKSRPNPMRDLGFILVDIVISFVLGLLPGLDNFSHIGGFAMGLVLGICILHSPASLRQRIAETEPYVPVAQINASSASDPNSGLTGFLRAPRQFFKGRKQAWWAWWAVRVAMLVAALIVFILLINNFYVYRKTCSWCKYLSCLDITVGGTNWCDIGNLDVENTTTTAAAGNVRRTLETLTGSVALW